MESPHPGVHQDHHDNADEQGIGGQPLIPIAVGFRNHFIADHVEHRSAGKGQGEGEDGAGYAGGEIADEGADHLYQAGQGLYL